MKNKMKVAVIGAGASGIVAAITAVKYGAEVTLFEKNDRVGKKILSTGNGKCNLGNLEFSVEQYYCNDREKLKGMFRVFSVWDTITFFESMGLMVRNRNGYLYPYSEQASAVLDVLRMELERKKVRVMPEAEITEAFFHKSKKLFEVKTATGNVGSFQKLILACGSPASLKKGEGLTGYELAKKFGHRVGALLPGLASLRSSDGFEKALSGVRCKAKITLVVEDRAKAAEEGEVQFTDYGISGIPVFQVSHLAAYALKDKKNVEVLVDFFPDQEEAAFAYMSRLRFGTHKEMPLENYLTGTLNKKINMVLIKQAGLKPQMKAAEAGWDKIWGLMQNSRAFVIHIKSVNPLENSQVCAGGVSFDEITLQMESRLTKGLYFAGEMVDVDGKCGGYNLQWAWSSGYIAGRNAAGSSTLEIAEGREYA